MVKIKTKLNNVNMSLRFESVIYIRLITENINTYYYFYKSITNLN